MVSKTAVKDLEEINEQMLHTSQGNLQERLPEQRFAETESLAESYNEILSRLSTIDQTRSEFVSNVSHELKAPITSMKVLADMTFKEIAEVLNMPMGTVTWNYQQAVKILRRFGYE